MSAAPTPRGSRGLLVFDDDCGFCQRSAGLAVRVFRIGAQTLPMSAVDLAAHRIDPDRARLEMPFVDASGGVVYGHHAWAAALRSGPRWARGLGRLLDSRPVGVVAAPVYRWVAANRHRLPGGTGACEVPRATG